MTFYLRPKVDGDRIQGSLLEFAYQSAARCQNYDSSPLSVLQILVLSLSIQSSYWNLFLFWKGCIAFTGITWRCTFAMWPIDESSTMLSPSYQHGEIDGPGNASKETVYSYDRRDRFLAALPPGSQSLRSDYSILSVSVMTLGLIMAVEVFRHRLDHAAVGRPFFKAVLEGVYAECKCRATLCIQCHRCSPSSHPTHVPSQSPLAMQCQLWAWWNCLFGCYFPTGTTSTLLKRRFLPRFISPCSTPLFSMRFKR